MLHKTYIPTMLKITLTMLISIQSTLLFADNVPQGCTPLKGVTVGIATQHWHDGGRNNQYLIWEKVYGDVSCTYTYPNSYGLCSCPVNSDAITIGAGVADPGNDSGTLTILCISK